MSNSDRLDDYQRLQVLRSPLQSRKLYRLYSIESMERGSLVGPLRSEVFGGELITHLFFELYAHLLMLV